MRVAYLVDARAHEPLERAEDDGAQGGVAQPSGATARRA